MEITGTVCVTLMKYVLVSTKDGKFAERQMALSTVVVEIDRGPTYRFEAAVGVEPSKVYLMVALGLLHEMETVCPDG